MKLRKSKGLAVLVALLVMTCSGQTTLRAGSEEEESIPFVLSINESLLEGKGENGETLEGICVSGEGSSYLKDSTGNSWYTEYYGDPRGGLLRIHKDSVEEWYYDGECLRQVPAYESSVSSGSRLVYGQKSDLFRFIDSELRKFCYNSTFKSDKWYYNGEVVAKFTEDEALEVLFTPTEELNSVLFKELLEGVEDSRRVGDLFIVESRVGCVTAKLTFQVGGYCYKAVFTDELKGMSTTLRIDLSEGKGFLGSRWSIVMKDESRGNLYSLEDGSLGESFDLVFDGSLYTGSVSFGDFFSEVCKVDEVVVNDWWQMLGDVNDDGVVDVVDLMFIKSSALGESDLNSKQTINADFNDNGELDVSDIVATKRLLMECCP